MSRCSSCGAPILWARTERGKRIPLDREPFAGDDPRGLFVLRELGRGVVGPLALAVTPAAFADEPRYRAHFASCPQAAEHRRSA
jgi:hypothetical protein